MAHDSEARRKVRAAYVGGMPLTTAASTNGIAYQTARGWKRAEAAEGNDWDVLRQARRMSNSSLEAMANQVLDAIAEEFVATLKAVRADKKMDPKVKAQILVQLMDGYNKAVAAATRALPNANRLAVAMDVIRFLSQYIGQHQAKHKAWFVQTIEGAGDAIAREFGSGL